MNPPHFIGKTFLQPFEGTFNKNFAPILSSPLVILLVGWLAVIQIILSINTFPPRFKEIMNHFAIKSLITFSAIYVSTHDFIMSAFTSIVLLGLYYTFLNVSEKFTLAFPETNTHPQCSDIKVDDLLALFEGDRSKLKKTMYESGVPLNVNLTDMNAPLIATYLINFGHKVSGKCHLP